MQPPLDAVATQQCFECSSRGEGVTHFHVGVGPHCTNLSTQQPMLSYSFDQSEADTILFSAYAVLRESGHTDPVVIDQGCRKVVKSGGGQRFGLRFISCSLYTSRGVWEHAPQIIFGALRQLLVQSDAKICLTVIDEPSYRFYTD